MSSPILHSPLSMRISRAQLEVLIADLEPLVWLSRTNAANRKFLREFPSFLLPVPLPRISSAGHKRLLQLWTRLEHLSSGPQQSRHRLAFDVFEAALCSTALRAAMRVRSQPCLRPTVRNVGNSKRRRIELLHRMENYLRQIRRRFKAEMDNSARATKLLAEFDRYRRTLVRELFRHYPLVPNRFKALKRRLFQTLVTIAEEGLKEAGSEVPPAKELRKLVSRWLRDVRRFRADVAPLDLLREPPVGKRCLVTFIQTRWARMNPNMTSTPDLAIVLSDVGDRLRAVMTEVD